MSYRFFLETGITHRADRDRIINESINGPTLTCSPAVVVGVTPPPTRGRETNTLRVPHHWRRTL